ncbi:MAG: outer membrane lipoprotein-sorting protein [Holophagales bacterium]|nr:outer membrane lipoprotein-sorting protein [Holophagales bacterium]
MREALPYLVLTLLPLSVSVQPAHAQQTPAEIVKAAIQNWRGQSSYMEQRMVVHRPDWQRETSMVSVTRGEKDALVRFTAPAKDAGNATLKLDQKMWVFTPRLNQVISLPASMMAQSWMGSDFSYDDLAKSDRIVTDYELAFEPEEEVEGRRVYVIEATPYPDAPVVWGKEVLRIREDNALLERAYYDQRGALVRRMVASRIELIDGRPYPRELRMIDAEQEGHWTDVLTEAGNFDVDPPGYLFTQSNLRNPRQWTP